MLFIKKKTKNIKLDVLAVKQVSPRCGVRLCRGEAALCCSSWGRWARGFCLWAAQRPAVLGERSAAVVDRALQPLPVSLFMLKGTNVVRQHGLGTDVASPQSEEVSSRVLAGSSSSIAAPGFFFSTLF